MSVMTARVLIMLADASSRQCPRTRGTRVLQCSVLSASVPLLSLYLRLMPLSVRSALVLAVVMVIMIPS